jgi:hypothetical protein
MQPGAVTASQPPLIGSQPTTLPGSVHHYVHVLKMLIQEKGTGREIMGTNPSPPETQWQAIGEAVKILLNTGTIHAYAFGNKGTTLLLWVSPDDHSSANPYLQAASPWYTLQNMGPFVPPEYARESTSGSFHQEISLTAAQQLCVQELHHLADSGSLKKVKLASVQDPRFKPITTMTADPGRDLLKAIQFMVYEEGYMKAYAYGKTAGTFLLWVGENAEHTTQTQQECASGWFSLQNPERGVVAQPPPLANPVPLEKEMLKALHLGEELHLGGNKECRTITVKQLESLVPTLQREIQRRLGLRPNVVTFTRDEILKLGWVPEKIFYLLRYLVLTDRAAALFEGNDEKVLYLTVEAQKMAAHESDDLRFLFAKEKMHGIASRLRGLKELKPLIPFEWNQESSETFNYIYESLKRSLFVYLAGEQPRLVQIHSGNREGVVKALDLLVLTGLIYAWRTDNLDDHYPTFWVQFDKRDKIHPYDRKPSDKVWNKEAVEAAQAFQQTNRIALSPASKILEGPKNRIFSSLIDEMNSRRVPGPFQTFMGEDSDKEIFEFLKANRLIHDFIWEKLNDTGDYRVNVFVKDFDRI